MEGTDAFDRRATASDGGLIGKLMNPDTAREEYAFMQRLAKIDPLQTYGVYAEAPRRVAIDKLVKGMGRHVAQEWSADGKTPRFVEGNAVDGAAELEKCSGVKRFLSSVAAHELSQIVLAKAQAGSMANVIKELMGRNYKPTFNDVRRQGPVALAHLRAARNLFEGLAFYHTHPAGIVHRDIKPDNIVLATGSVQAPVAYKFIDFGLSVTVADAARHAPGWGTPGFIPLVSYLQDATENPLTNEFIAHMVRRIPRCVPRTMADAATLQKDIPDIEDNAQRLAPSAVPSLLASLPPDGDSTDSHPEWQLGNLAADIYALAVVTLSELYAALLMVTFDRAPGTAGAAGTAIPVFWFANIPEAELPSNIRFLQAQAVEFRPVHDAFYKFMYAAYSGQLWGKRLLDAYDEALKVAERVLPLPCPVKN